MNVCLTHETESVLFTAVYPAVITEQTEHDAMQGVHCAVCFSHVMKQRLYIGPDPSFYQTVEVRQISMAGFFKTFNEPVAGPLQHSQICIHAIHMLLCRLWLNIQDKSWTERE